MTALSLICIATAFQGHPGDIRVDGPGYFRLLSNGRVAYAKSGRLQIVNGKLGMYNSPLLPTIQVSGSVSDILVSEDGTVSLNGGPLGQLTLAVFASSIGDTGLLTSSERPRIETTATAGSIKSGPTKLVVKSSAAQPIAVEPSIGIEIRILPTAEVSGEQILLRDVATLTGPESIGDIDLGPAPVIGRSKQVERSHIVSRLRAKGFRIENLLISGTGPIAVTRLGMTISNAEFLRVAEQAAVNHLGGGWKLSATGTTEDFQTAKGKQELVATKVTERNGVVSVLVEILVDGKRVNSRTVTFNATAPQMAVAAGSKVRVKFIRGDLVVEAEGVVNKAAALGASVEVTIRVDGNKDQESTHVGTVVAAGIVEVKL